MRSVGFYPRLAAQSLRLNGKFYLPYLLSCAVAVAMHYDIHFLNMNSGLEQIPGSDAIGKLLAIMVVVVAFFSMLVIFYTNSFLMKRRQKELGLYNILGMEKRHLRRLLLWETIFSAIISIGGGLLMGILLSRLYLSLLCAILQTSVPIGFEVPPLAVIFTVFVYANILLLNLLRNLRQVSKTKPIELLRGSDTGEREPRTKWLLAIIGLIALVGGYGIALFLNPLNDLSLLLVAVLLVIVATYCLFTSGSIAVLKALRRNKAYYYQPTHFTAVSGMLHRMKRNAAGLASICILSTMVLVTTSATLCLYMGTRSLAENVYITDVQTRLNEGNLDDLQRLKEVYREVEAETGIGMGELYATCFYTTGGRGGAGMTEVRDHLDPAQEQVVQGDPSAGPSMVFVGCNVAPEVDTAALAQAIDARASSREFSAAYPITEDGRNGRTEMWTYLSSLFFVGLFLSSLFLLATALIIYYKQVSEGYEDARGFVIMQQVGMTAEEVKATIKSQVSMVFLLPLLAAGCHMLAALPMVYKLLRAFGLTNVWFYVACGCVALAAYGAVYFLIYVLTAREYYRIVRR